MTTINYQQYVCTLQSSNADNSDTFTLRTITTISMYFLQLYVTEISGRKYV